MDNGGREATRRVLRTGDGVARCALQANDGRSEEEEEAVIEEYLPYAKAIERGELPPDYDGGGAGSEDDEDAECLPLPVHTPHFWKFLCTMMGLLTLFVGALLLLAFRGWFSSPWLWGAGLLLGVSVYFGIPTIKWHMEAQERKER